MKKGLLTIILGFWLLYVQAQTCISYAAPNNVTAQQQLEQNRALQKYITNNYSSSAAAGLIANTQYIIPVVFHIVHNGGIENITDLQVQSQVDALNAAFSTYNIQFALATKKPNGSTFNGITRTQDTLTNYDYSDEMLLKSIEHFPVCNYLNIWVVKKITLGGDTSPTGYAPITVGRYNDYMKGVVIKYSSCGSNAFGTTFPSLSGNATLGYTLVHEIGHLFGLYHPFETACTFASLGSQEQFLKGDLCYDTPPMDASHYFSGSTTFNTCHENYFPGGVDMNDIKYNYMDYQSDNYRNQFTVDQQNRLWATLDLFFPQLWSDYSLAITGCADLPRLVFYADETQLCLNDTLRLHLISTSGYSYKFRVNGGAAISANNTELKIVLSTAGLFSLRLIAYTFSAPIDSIEKINYIKVFNCTPAASSESNWFFGKRAGITFTVDGPKINQEAEKHNTLRTIEGSIAQSNKDGELLFYGGGDGNDIFSDSKFHIYSRKHVEMPNSPILGAGSSTQGGIALPFYNDSTRFLILTTYGEDLGYNRGFRYSVINMNLYGGYGGIDSSQKNKIIRVPGLESVDVNGDTVFMTNEGISAINTCSDNGYWIVVNGRTSGKADHHICVFKFDSSGIHFKDTFSMGVSGSGSFRFSPDGNYLAFSHNDGATCDIFPFDRSQGIINTGSSNVIHVKGINGLAFSANSKVLYVLGLDSTAINYVLLQYDLTASNVLATEKLVTEPGFFTSVDELALAHLILGLDNKIYLARNNSDFIGVINNPEYLNSASSPNACNFLFYGFRLEYDADCDGSKSLMGFPNFPTRVADANNKSMGYRALNCNKYIFTNSNCRYKKWLIRNSNNTTLLSINNTDTLNYTFNSTGTYYVLLVIDQDTTVQIISVTLPNAPIYGQNQIHSTSNLAAGVYFVKLTVNGKDYLNKLIRY